MCAIASTALATNPSKTTEIKPEDIITSFNKGLVYYVNPQSDYAKEFKALTDATQDTKKNAQLAVRSQLWQVALITEKLVKSPQEFDTQKTMEAVYQQRNLLTTEMELNLLDTYCRFYSAGEKNYRDRKTFENLESFFQFNMSKKSLQTIKPYISTLLLREVLQHPFTNYLMHQTMRKIMTTFEGVFSKNSQFSQEFQWQTAWLLETLTHFHPLYLKERTKDFMRESKIDGNKSWSLVIESAKNNLPKNISVISPYHVELFKSRTLESKESAAFSPETLLGKVIKNIQSHCLKNVLSLQAIQALQIEYQPSLFTMISRVRKEPTADERTSDTTTTIATTDEQNEEPPKKRRRIEKNDLPYWLPNLKGVIVSNLPDDGLMRLFYAAKLLDVSD